MRPGSVSHPHGNGEGLFKVGAHQAVGYLDGLRPVEFKHLVAVMSVICGQSNRPVGRAARSRKELHGARAGSYNTKEKI